MFAGHYAPALALRARFRDVPLWRLFVAAQAVDVAFWVLVGLGAERVEIRSSAPGPLSLALPFMPWTHSLAATVAWGLATFAVAAGVGRRREGAVLAVAVMSHWLGDLLVHEGDLPLLTGQGVRVGFGLWQPPLLGWGIEAGLVAMTTALLLRGGASRRVLTLGGALIAAQTLLAFVMPMPPSTMLLGAMTEASYAGFAALAWWTEAGRRAA
jgi:hypothetical protein